MLLKSWLLDVAIPLWLAHGQDPANGGFHEALDLRTHRCTAPFRRLRVAARQTVVFAQAHACGVPGAASAMQAGLAFLENHAAQQDGGYAWRFDLNHRPIDLKRDLYDHAFVLLALATAAPHADTPALHRRALALLAWLDTAFAHPEGGYQESLPPAWPRRQNPHMHLLEALLAAHATFGSAIFLARAQSLIDLFATRMRDPATGALPEFFDDAWRPARTASGTFLTEPGHHCEWSWLLATATAQGARVPADAAPRLLAFVARHAIDPTHGALIDEVSSDGQTLSPAARLWPQTERLRAALLYPELDRDQAVRALCAYLRPDGLWHERRGGDGVLSDEPAPASSLYHLTGAILACG